ncbi:MAG: hypothetical protein FGM14_02715 [Flavobacteriales bacterium]|nr:hypothetical protein [Flavobacteriales bacterium]
MSSTDFFYALNDLFQKLFLFYDVVGNYFNNIVIVFGFLGFGYWMNLQRKFNAASNVPVEIKDNKGWYKENADKKQLK